MFYLQTRCISVHVQDHVLVWFTQLRESLVMIDTTIHDEEHEVVLSYYDRPKYTHEQAWEIYLTLFRLK